VTIEIVIDDPSLVVLVGAAGAGKSTFAARHFAADEVLSSDRFRAIVSGEEANQAATKAAFALLHRVLSRRLAERRLTVVDATSVQPAARRALIARANAARIPTMAIVLDLPPDTVIARNAARPARTVDMAVVRHQLAGVRTALDGPSPALDREGFAQVVVLRDPAEVDRVTIRRRPTPATSPPHSMPEGR
jgi:protein phosphatase